MSHDDGFESYLDSMSDEDAVELFQQYVKEKRINPFSNKMPITQEKFDEWLYVRFMDRPEIEPEDLDRTR